MNEDTHSVRGHMIVKVSHVADRDLNPNLLDANVPALNDIFYLFIIHFQIPAQSQPVPRNSHQLNRSQGFASVKQEVRLNIWSGHPSGLKGQ